MPLPLIPVLKVLALGSLKLVFLLIGAAFFPVLSLRFILSGASGMLLPTLDWLEANQRLDPQKHAAIIEDLNALQAVEFTRAEARHQLLSMTRNTVAGMARAVMSIPATIWQGIKWITK